MSTSIILLQYIIKDQNESNDSYLALHLNKNICEKKAKSMYMWYPELMELFLN